MITLLIILVIFKSLIAIPCDLRSFKTGLVCVCNSTTCDTLEFKLPETDGEVLIVSTSQTGLRHFQTLAHFGPNKVTIPKGPYHLASTRKPNVFDKVQQFVKFPPRTEEPIDSVVNISFNRTATYQKIIGFGGAFTGAVSYNLKQLASDELRRHVYESYFSKTIGSAYNLLRFSIGGSDFDLEPWAYNEYPEHDPYLTNFKELDSRDSEIIDQVNELKTVTNNFDIKLIGAAWSPPRWMKTNGDWSGKNVLRDEYYQTWADYHVRYLELMSERNFSFWAVSTGNEPLNGIISPYFVHFMNLGWLPRDQGKWLAENLGPSLRKSATVFNTKILAGDDQRYTFPWWFDRMYDSYPDVAQYIDGLAVHWFADKFSGPKPLDLAAGKFPGKFLIATEGCSGDKPWDIHKPVLGSWTRCEDYILDIIEDLNHHVSAWVDWNLILDLEGGPSHARKFSDTPIVVNETEIYKQPIFYALSHFSRFIIPDSLRVHSRSSHKFIKTTVFLRPDGYTAVVLYNIADHNLDVNIFDKADGVLRLGLPGKSLHTLLFK